MLKNCINTIIVLLLICSCSSDSGQRRLVKSTITRYDQVLAECYKNMNMNPLQEVATAEHATKVYYHMAALGEGRTRLVSALKHVSFKEISFLGPDAAVALTDETWDFAHVNIDSGKTTLEEKDFHYQMAYELKKEGERWLVSNARSSQASAGEQNK